ncbi:Crp/Fnr family transcriptional regulator [Arundinibacter roseus]|uniref:Crp/Fnr family transcriptional regulator n=1 Tax=Arundinibacter roseus TaxID=2070510 RepID=A0A4R4JXY5_9BACT|nr:Crp/Fnr family transcriptional regulator [Arundinibacter roseus]TDB59553.1 Crp/Fnr family transcriptional regulator [Arundinibacter roseus]
MNHTTQPEKAFQKAVESLMECSPAVHTTILKRLRVRTFSRKEIFATLDPFQQGLHLIYEGLARCYYQDAKGRKTTACFVCETQFLPLTTGAPDATGGALTLEFLEETTVMTLTAEDLAELYRQHPGLSQLPYLVAQRQLVRQEMWLRAFRLYSSGELLMWFQREYPCLKDRIANKHLASFVGLAPESLSRLRAKKK